MIGPLTETPFRLKPTPPLARIAYDRILLLEFDGKTVRLVPSIEVKTQEGIPLEVKSNPIRILPQSVGKTLVWRHLAS